MRISYPSVIISVQIQQGRSYLEYNYYKRLLHSSYSIVKLILTYGRAAIILHFLGKLFVFQGYSMVYLKSLPYDDLFGFFQKICQICITSRIFITLSFQFASKCSFKIFQISLFMHVLQQECGCKIN